MARRLSGLQRDVLRLYRQSFRMVRTKPKETQEHWRQFIRDAFRRNQHLPKKSFSVIEHLLRTGHRRFEMYSSSQIKDIH